MIRFPFASGIADPVEHDRRVQNLRQDDGQVDPIVKQAEWNPHCGPHRWRKSVISLRLILSEALYQGQKRLFVRPYGRERPAG